MVPDSPTRTDTLVREMRIRQLSKGAPGWRALWPTAAWRLFQLLVIAGVFGAGRHLLATTPYRIDIDVYRMGGRAWLDGASLYSDGVLFHTEAGLNLPFTYPPLAAAVFAPFAWLSLPAASATITVITFALLLVTTMIVLTRLRVWEHSPRLSGAAWVRRCWLAAAIVAPAVVYLEPIRSNFEFGQINVVLMTLVIADCVPRKTPWPRGLLLGVAIAFKLTPAVFLLYFLLRRDTRALLTSAASAILATAVGFQVAMRDSWQYWTETVHDTDRIGTATYLTNQNIAGTLARLGLGETPRFVIWVVACFAVLGLTVWAVRRVLRSGDGDQPVLALICVAMFGLVVSPVSWSHHWVWALPAVLVMAVLALRHRSIAMGAVSVTGVLLMYFAPIHLMIEHHETSASLWRQLLGGSYLWWALALIIVAGTVNLKERDGAQAVDDSTPAHASS
ncbi:polyprenol-phosphate-mannose-dependent alpha-(1-2)-phosphatidylinositol mannoside mannosyltransferase [Mycobacterium antarcticum]|nr:polyprenol-phosphate-mannose-dependent alpha-(1-2)-phosphatidylinositol mannoside mannosyltransferase [Mycolicibacterium sp. TUM20985]